MVAGSVQTLEHIHTIDGHERPRVRPRLRAAARHAPRPHTVPEEARRAILLAGVRIAAELGVDALTMRGIASRAGFSVTMLYSHFEGKAALVDEMRRIGRARLDARLVRAGAGIADVGERLLRLCSTYVAFGCAHPWLYALLSGAHDDVSRRRHHDALASVFAPHVGAALSSGIERGYLRNDVDLDATAWQVWTAMHGLASALLALTENTRARAVARRPQVQGLVAMLLRGLE